MPGRAGVLFAFVGVAIVCTLILFLRPHAIEITSQDIQNAGLAQSKKEEYVSPFQNKHPFEVKAIYVTPYTAVSEKRFSSLLDWVDKSELNAMVIDIKDATGKVYFKSNTTLAQQSGATKEAILDLPALVGALHKRGIYAIARIVVFQDPLLAKARPEWAVQYSDGRVWRDNKGLSWMDPAATQVWEYNFAIATEAARAGFDEINFDYIRFPSDGDLKNAVFPHWQERLTKAQAMQKFYGALWDRFSYEGIKVSADIFGLSFYDLGDLNIGQELERIVPYFDYVAPMTYPSHYARGSFGFSNPAMHPYEIVLRTLKKGNERIALLASRIVDPTATPSDVVIAARSARPYGDLSRVRPWVQDFDLLGVPYTKDMILEQIRALQEAKAFGFMLWDPSNEYTRSAFPVASNP